tara:strand:+ start:3141 stop:4256 length:1116 start_codon:yes stop_codon:yes gene_type:complete
MSGIEETFAAATGSKLVEVEKSGSKEMINVEEPQQEQPQQQQESAAPAEVTQEEQKNTDRSLNSEQTKEEPLVQDQDSSEESMLKKLSERLGKSFNSFDELKSNLEKSSTSVNFANEQLAKINEYVSSTGRSIDDYMKTQATDFEKMDEKAIVKEFMKANNPKLSSKEVDLLFGDTYKIDDDLEEGEISVGHVKLKQAAQDAVKYFNEQKEKYATPTEQNQTQSDSQQVDMEEYNTLRTNWLGEMKNEVQDIGAIEFEVGNDTWQYNLSDDDRNQIIETNSSLGEKFFTDRYINESGKWDMEKLAIDMHVIDNMDKIINSAVSAFASKKTESVVKDMKNVNMGARQTTSQDQPNTLGDQILEAMRDEISSR